MRITAFTISFDSVNDLELVVSSKKEFSIDRLKGPKWRCNIVLLVLLPGNVQPSPGPDAAGVSFKTQANYKTRAGLGFIHSNVHSLLATVDIIHIWAHSADAVVMGFSE